MPMNKDLFLAILSMDSYNRGYGQGISGLFVPELNPDGTPKTIIKIGNAAILRDANDQAGVAIAAGFYALAYNVSQVKDALGNPVFGTSGTVIAYRGTDFDDTAGYSSLRDIWKGWIVGAGVPTGQANLALDFYKAVNNGVSAFDLTGGRSITLTGHSLGGGLAGFAGMVHGDAVVGFDYMPFMAATYAAWIVEYTRRLEASGRSIGTVPTAALLTYLNLRYPSYAGFSGISLEGEVNRLLRDGTLALAIGSIFATGTSIIPYVGPILSALSAITGAAIAGAQVAESVLLANQARTVSTYGWDTPYDPLAGTPRHSMATLVISLYAEEQEKSNASFAYWRAGGMANLLYTALYDGDLAKAITATSARGALGNEAATMRTAIAYSAISEGGDEAKPFGDTAIISMFNDAGDLGTVLKGAGVPAIIRDNADALARMLVQYAGKLALGDVEKAGDTHNVTEGILKTSLGGGLLSVDMSDQRWLLGAAHRNYGDRCLFTYLELR